MAQSAYCMWLIFLSASRMSSGAARDAQLLAWIDLQFERKKHDHGQGNVSNNSVENSTGVSPDSPPWHPLSTGKVTHPQGGSINSAAEPNDAVWPGSETSRSEYPTMKYFTMVSQGEGTSTESRINKFVDNGVALTNLLSESYPFAADQEVAARSSSYSSANPVTTSHGDYTIGWICALAIELAAATGTLERRYESLPQPSHDHNSYELGQIGHHKVVIACLPAGRMGNVPAAVVASQMVITFPSVRFVLMVGVGGGAPSGEQDVRLGDVVVGVPENGAPGVMQYRSGKMLHEKKFQQRGFINSPPQVVLSAVTRVWASHLNGASNMPQYVSEMISKFSRSKNDFTCPGDGLDILFSSHYVHQNPRDTTCQLCDKSDAKVVQRTPRETSDAFIHHGLIASGDLSLRDSVLRDELCDEYNILCFEMEAAGLMNDFPCLVIRGICDYCDSHKNKRWQPYAAVTASAYARELLHYVPWSLPQDTPPATQVV